jgi:superfamily I DNA/RNA helicase/RecB family exonuclease
MTTLRRAPQVKAEGLVLDEVQRAAVAHRGGVLRVLGAPGTGKTALAVEIVAQRVLAGELAPDQCLLLASGRRAAGELRERATTRLGRTSTEPLARSLQALGFGILRRLAVLEGDPMPRLLNGPEQDAVLRDLLAGHQRGDSSGPDWPARVTPALQTASFRTELRDLLMRAVELGLEPDDLHQLGVEQQRPDWCAAAQVLREYDEVTALASPGAYDPAWILGAAADRLEDSPEALDALRGDVRLVVVDDAQELTPAALRLLRTIGGSTSGVEMVLLGDPDAATQTFRGAEPRILTQGWSSLGEPGTTLVLPRSYRSPERLREVAVRVAGHIGVLGDAAHRSVVPAGSGGLVEVALLRSAAQEAQFIAGRLRAAHLRDGVPWSQMGVVVRGRARTATLRRVLAATGVPVATAESDLPVREEAAVRPFLTLFHWALTRSAGGDAVVGGGFVPTGDVVVDLLTSPLGGADSVVVRRLRRGLFADELSAGGSRSSDDLLVAAVLEPAIAGDLGPDAIGLRRIAAVLAAGEAALCEPEATAESVLWAMWSAAGVAQPWRRAALGSGVPGPGALGSGALAARADRDLDAVLALFAAAAAHTDRLPGAAPATFLDHLAAQEVAADSLVARAQRPDSVAILTPAAAVGRSWRIAVVAGVQEGVWPDLRLRGSLLGSQELVDVVTGREGSRRAARAAVRHDETRLFLVAVTRASERLLVTAVRSDEEQPSPYLDLVDPRPDLSESRGFADATEQLTLTGLVAELRRAAADDDPALRGVAVRALDRLSAAGVAAADPQGWWPLIDVSDDRPRRAADALVQLSPSALQMLSDCALRALLQRSGGEGPPVGSAEIGTLVHAIAHECADDEARRRHEELDARWPSLEQGDGWVGERKRTEAHDMLQRYSRYLDDAAAHGWHRVASEEEFSVTVGRAELRGTVDRVEGDDAGRIRIVDLKTGGLKVPASDVPRHPQLGAYQIAASHGGLGDVGSSCSGAQLVHIGKAGGTNASMAKPKTMIQAQVPPADDPDPHWAEQLVGELAERAGGASFAATVGVGCRVCPVQACCPVRPEGGRI